MFLKLIVICSLICLVQSSCKDYLRELTDGQAKFVQCVSMHSVPITACMSCQARYQYILEMYNVLSTNCSDIYFDKDRLNLIASTEYVLTGLWSKAYCDDCFNNNNRMVFTEKYNSFSECLSGNKNTPCKNCKQQYLELNTFYINLDQHNNGEVCYDIQDSMNRTRNMWSKVLNCCRREQNLTLFMIALGVTSCLPLLFYGTTYCVTKRQERYQRVLYNEEPYNSEIPSSSSASQRYNTNNLSNPTQSILDNFPTSSGTDVIHPAASTSLRSKNINEQNNDMESSDDELLTNTTFKSKEITKNI